MTETFKSFRDPVLSLYQSAVGEVAEKIDQSAKVSGVRAALRRSASGLLPPLAAQIAEREFRQLVDGISPAPIVELSPRELSKTGIAQVCAEWGLRYMKALAIGNEQAIEQLRNEFTAGTCDPAWLTTLEAYRSYFEGGKRKAVPYIRAATVGPRTIEIKANARIAVTGDWGTGATPAVEVLKLIAGDQPDILMHLGDIYYSGTPAECRQNFLDPINLVLRTKATVPVFSLSGNHDMYSGGVGYYDLLRQLNPAPFTQTASFFCLRAANESWQLLAMDTGLHDDNPAGVSEALTYIEEDELAWHRDRIEEFEGRTILLSHHQLFSAFSPIGPVKNSGKRSSTNPLLLKAFQQLAGSKKIAAWFWGHEHTLSIYQPFLGLDRGRCVGHGAVPVSLRDDIYKPLPDIESTPSLVESTKLGTRGGVYNHGFALLNFQDRQCRAEYYQVTEKGRDLIFRETFC
jgi:Calcineurin-like phosphoesterase